MVAQSAWDSHIQQQGHSAAGSCRGCSMKRGAVLWGAQIHVGAAFQQQLQARKANGVGAGSKSPSGEPRPVAHAPCSKPSCRSNLWRRMPGRRKIWRACECGGARSSPTSRQARAGRAEHNIGAADPHSSIPLCRVERQLAAAIHAPATSPLHPHAPLHQSTGPAPQQILQAAAKARSGGERRQAAAGVVQSGDDDRLASRPRISKAQDVVSLRPATARDWQRAVIRYSVHLALRVREDLPPYWCRSPSCRLRRRCGNCGPAVLKPATSRCLAGAKSACAVDCKPGWRSRHESKPAQSKAHLPPLHDAAAGMPQGRKRMQDRRERRDREQITATAETESVQKVWRQGPAAAAAARMRAILPSYQLLPHAGANGCTAIQPPSAA